MESGEARSQGRKAWAPIQEGQHQIDLLPTKRERVAVAVDRESQLGGQGVMASSCERCGNPRKITGGDVHPVHEHARRIPEFPS